jgi:hypothetical protein
MFLQASPKAQGALLLWRVQELSPHLKGQIHAKEAKPYA